MTEPTNTRGGIADVIDRLMKLIPARLRRGATVVPVVRLSGVIGAVTPLRPGMSLAGVARVLERAFAMKHAKAVALVINSPGGSPVQSRQIYLRIRQLAAEKKLPVLVFVEDVAASGGYWLATAADEIHLDPNSIVGSIGVISASFGFQDLLARHGVERRVHTAGEDKSLLDPFRPERPEDVERLKRLQAAIHANFIEQVRARRGARLAEGDLFTGDVWIGQAAVELGLADGIGHLVPVMRARYGDKLRFATIAPRRPLFRRLGLPGIGEAFDALESLGHWARYGLMAR